MVPGRSAGVPEWLDLIKQEFDSLSHEAMVAKAQRDECEHKSMHRLIWRHPSLSVLWLLWELYASRITPYLLLLFIAH